MQLLGRWFALSVALSTATLACGGGGSDDTGQPDTEAGTTQTTTAGTSTSSTDTGVPTTGTDSSGGSEPTSEPGSSSGPGSTSSTSGTTGDTGEPEPVVLPPADGGLDYQLGGAYPPPAEVTIVSRDRNAAPEPGLYNICYVNGFQAQPDEADWWLNEHPDLILRDGNGDPVIDVDWDEMLLDTSTPEKRAALAVIVGGWIAECATDGFDAVEIDNLDSYSRSTGLLTQDGAVATMALFSDAAHASGLAIAQKNSTELLDRVAEMGTDFAVAEECNTYDECGDYVGVYGDAVLMIEYVADDFQAGCAAWPGHSIVLRDLDLVTPQDPGYVYQAC